MSNEYGVMPLADVDSSGHDSSSNSGSTTTTANEYVIANKQDIVNLADIVRETLGTTDSMSFDSVMAGISEAIEAGGGSAEMGTFTPAADTYEIRVPVKSIPNYVMVFKTPNGFNLLSCIGAILYEVHNSTEVKVYLFGQTNKTTAYMPEIKTFWGEEYVINNEFVLNTESMGYYAKYLVTNYTYFVVEGMSS